MLLAIDSNVFIAALSGVEEQSPAAGRLLRRVASGEHQAVISSITYGEVLGLMTSDEELDLESFFAQLSNLSTVPANDTICLAAGRLRREHGSRLKLPDAIHLASALSAGAKVFVTSDLPLAKAANKLITTKLPNEL